MDTTRIPKPGEFYQHFKDKLYQIITVASDSETGVQMVVYQALYGDFKTYVRPLDMFVSEVDHMKYPEVSQKYRFELIRNQDEEHIGGPTTDRTGEHTIPQIQPHITDHTQVQSHDTGANKTQVTCPSKRKEDERVEQSSSVNTPEGSVNSLLLKFLDSPSYSKKLEVLSSNTKYLNDRLINDMAVAIDCMIEEGPIDQRINELKYCLQAMCRFEDKRQR